MLQLCSLHMFQFRNYASVRFDFSERVIGICGANGTGKTNLLDAIYYLGLTRSYFSRPDAQNVMHGTQGMRIEGHYLLDQKPVELVCIIRENNRKEFIANDEPYKKMSAHIGRFPCVMVAPDDVMLISGTSEERRHFIDSILCQMNTDYLQALIQYNKILQQRNSVLKQAGEGQSIDETLLSIFNDQLSEAGQSIYETRRVFLQEFLPLVNAHYLRIAGKDDQLQLEYISQLHETELSLLLQQHFRKDLALQRTTMGIHRDDLDLRMNALPFKLQASQGQRKSLLFALKLAEWDTLKAAKGFPPLLLLDDVFEKLDAARMHNLLEWVCRAEDAQIFITDTHKERLVKHLEDIGTSFQIIALS